MMPMFFLSRAFRSLLPGWMTVLTRLDPPSYGSIRCGASCSNSGCRARSSTGSATINGQVLRSGGGRIVFAFGAVMLAIAVVMFNAATEPAQGATSLTIIAGPPHSSPSMAIAAPTEDPDPRGLFSVRR